MLKTGPSQSGDRFWSRGQPHASTSVQEASMAEKLVPAAQYLRMSTDHQQHSLANQSAAIAEYAEHNGFQIVKSYQDAGRSGLTLAERPALRALLKDVVNHEMPYKVILVYDVSRWGRFQDTDEAANYEFLFRTHA